MVVGREWCKLVYNYLFLNLPMHEEGPATLYWIYVLSMLI